MNLLRRFRAVWAWILFPMAFHAGMLAQDVALTGTVRDPGQLAVPGAQVSLAGIGVHQTTTSDAAGRFAFGVAPGSYVLTATKAGFNAVSQTVVVTQGTPASHDLSFTTANATANVTVQGSLSGTPAEGYYVGSVDRGVLGTTPIVF